MKLFRLLMLILLIFVLVNILSLVQAYADVRVKDIARIDQVGDLDLIGYGLVVGLAGTGDGKGTEFTVQSVVNMLERMGLTVPRDKVKVKNVAAVMVTAKLPQSARVGTSIDVTVSSLGDAKTLEGGTLLMTPLRDRQGQLYAYAQGPLSIGGFNVQVDDNKIVNNYTLVGRIPNGAKVEREPTVYDSDPNAFTLSLYEPDYTTVDRVVEAINKAYPGAAAAEDDGGVSVEIPKQFQNANGAVNFISTIEHLEVEPDLRAKVVINERTGTIVAGGNVSISPIALAHGNITVEIKSTPVISQPAPFSQGRTVESQDSYINVTDEQARVVYFEERSSISEIASALNAIGASPRDIIAIFQAIKQAGALRAELVIL
jgi:flagellar P-ring protein precursor FlgI